MQRNTHKLTVLLVMFVLMLTVISMTLCIGDEDKKDDDDADDNGDDNGNGGNNGDNNTTNDGPIQFIERIHTPEMPGPDEAVQFMIVFESENKLEKVDLFICNEQICFSPYTKSGTDVETNVIEFLVDQLPGNPEHGDEYSFFVKAEDILENEVTSDKIYFDIA